MAGQLDPRIPKHRAALAVRKLYERHCAGCCLHSVLDDGNFNDRSIIYCERSALENECTECWDLAHVLLKLNRTQRKWIYDGVWKSWPEKEVPAYCDYCPCQDCKYGADYLTHARTDQGFNICNVCYTYDPCIDGRRVDRKLGNPVEEEVPCKDKNCCHRPVIVGEWE